MPRRFARWLRSGAWILGLLLLAYAGCVGTPVPQPPAIDPPDATALSFPGTSSPPELLGAPGAAEPGATLRMTLLDRTDAATEVVVAADGGFRVPLGSALSDGEEFRLSLRNSEGRSPPVDVRAPNPARASFATEGCLLFEPELDVPASGAALLVLQNDCSSAAVIDALRLRVGADFTLSEPGPFTLAPGEMRTVDVSLAAGPAEEILFVDISAPGVARRAVSLIALP